MTEVGDPDTYVRENRDRLIKIFKHGSDDFVRAFALAAIVEYGSEPDLEMLRRDLDRAEEMYESE